jgi:hypothetical protein
MTDEEHFDRVVRERIAEARKLTGHSFARVQDLIDRIGAVETARRFISSGNIGRFPLGMRVLHKFGRLDLSIENAVVEFGEQGKVFSPKEVEAAIDRHQMLKMILKG